MELKDKRLVNIINIADKDKYLEGLKQFTSDAAEKY